jgi:hypothetical protein
VDSQSYKAKTDRIQCENYSVVQYDHIRIRSRGGGWRPARWIALQEHRLLLRGHRPEIENDETRRLLYAFQWTIMYTSMSSQQLQTAALHGNSPTADLTSPSCACPSQQVCLQERHTMKTHKRHGSVQTDRHSARLLPRVPETRTAAKVIAQLVDDFDTTTPRLSGDCGCLPSFLTILCVEVYLCEPERFAQLEHATLANHFLVYFNSGKVVHVQINLVDETEGRKRDCQQELAYIAFVFCAVLTETPPRLLSFVSSASVPTTSIRAVMAPPCSVPYEFSTAFVTSNSVSTSPDGSILLICMPAKQESKRPCVWNSPIKEAAPCCFACSIKERPRVPSEGVVGAAATAALVRSKRARQTCCGGAAAADRGILAGRDAPATTAESTLEAPRNTLLHRCPVDAAIIICADNSSCVSRG